MGNENINNNKEYLKYLYDYYLNSNFKQESLLFLANKFNSSLEQITQYIYEYMKYFMTYEEYKIYLSKMKKLNFDNFGVEIIILPNKNPILYDSKKITTNRLWNNLEEKKIVLEYLYKYCKEVNYKNEEIINLANKIGIHKLDLLYYVNIYIKEYIKIEEEKRKNQEDFYKKTKLILIRKPTQIAKMYESILDANNLEEIIKIIEIYNIDLKRIKETIGDFIVVYRSKDEKSEKELRNKISAYVEHLTNKNKIAKKKEKEEKKINELPTAKKIINEFIESGLSSINEFCKQSNIKRSTFYKYIEIIKEYDKNLYNLYLKKASTDRKIVYNNIFTIIKNIISFLKFGIKDNNNFRKFDLIDYYLYTNYTMDEILKFAKMILSHDDLLLLSDFIRKNKIGAKNDTLFEKMIMRQKIILHYQKDEKGNIIPESEVIFDNEEKAKLINFLKENKIPINSKTYNLLFRKYINGELDINNTIKKR